MTTVKRVGRGVALQVVARLLGLVISLATISVMTHYLGATGYGLLTTAVLFVGVFDAFTDFGVGTVIVRRAASGRGDLRALVGLNLGASLVYAIPLWLVMVAISAFVYPDDIQVRVGVAILGVGLALTSISTCYEVPYAAKVEFGGYFWAELLSKAATLALVWWVASSDYGLTAMFATQVVAPGIRLAVLALGSRRHGPFRPRVAWVPMVDLLKESIPLALIHLIGTLYYRADGLLLSLLSTPEQVGAYGLGYRLASNLGVIATSFAAATLTVMSAAYAESAAKFRKVAEATVSFMLALALPVAVLGPLMAGPVLRIIAEDELARLATAPTHWLLIATGIGFVNLTLSQLLISSRRQVVLTYLAGTVLLVNIAANLLLIPRLAAVGAGISITLTESISCFVAFFALRAATGTQWPWVFTLRLAPPLVVGLLTWWALHELSTVLGVAAAGCTYLAALVTIGPVSPSQIRRLRSGSVLDDSMTTPEG